MKPDMTETNISIRSLQNTIDKYKKLAQEQADALGRFTDEIDNFGELLRHLGSAFFRGFAHAQPIWDGKLVAHVSLLDSWNFLTDPDGNWYWKPFPSKTS